MLCKHCQTDMRLIAARERFICDTCQHSEPKNPPEPPPRQDVIKPLGNKTSFLCPSCDQVQLETGLIQRTEVAYCCQCNGFVIDRASLGDLVELLRSRYSDIEDQPAPYDASELDRKDACPACSGTMEAFVYCGPGNVVLTSCDTCQLSWFRDKQLDRIVRAPGQRDFDTKPTGHAVITRGTYFGITCLRLRSR